MVEQGPQNTQDVPALIACLLRQGKPVPAELEERSLQIAIEQEPANPQPVLSLIACLLRQGKPVPAELEERSLQIAIEQEPANPQPVLSLIACLLRQGKPVPAELEERSLQIAIEQEPANPQPVLSLIACLLRRGKPVPAELEERSLQIAIEQEPANPQPVLSLIACLLRQGKPVPAELEERSLQIAIEQEPANPQPVLSLIACLLRQGKPVPAELEERSLQIAIEQEPANPQPVLSLIACLLRRGKPVPAELEERSLWLAVEHGPQNMAQLRNLISCLQLQGKAVPAELEERWLRIVVEQNPNEDGQAARLIGTRRMTSGALVRFNRAFGAMDYEFAYAHIIAALESNPVSTWRVIVGTCSAAFSKVIRAVSKKAEIAALLDRLYADFPDIIVMTPNDDPAVLDQLKAQRAGNIDKGLPYYLFVPQAKSGSTFFGNVIPQGFGLTCPTYSAIDLQVVPSWAKAYRLGGSAYVTHLVPSPSNVALLRETGLTKVVVNTRDPRQIYLSALHHVAKYRSDFPELENTGFFSLSLDDKALAQLPGYREILDWLAGWVAATESGLDILFTTYERFLSDRDALVEKLLDFYGGDRRYFDRAAAAATHGSIDYHFRKGETDEWRTIFGPHVVRELNNAIPADWFERFGWRV